MKKSLPNLEIITEASIELGVDKSFIEKDWYAVLILEKISTCDYNIVFTGGTSLSKGYGLIKRFSEDLDFKICNSKDFGRAKRKTIRKDIIKVINNIEGISILDDSLKSFNESKFFSFNIKYPIITTPSTSLRPHLQLEFSFDEIRLSAESRDISTFISELQDLSPEFSINTISPVETAADKLSALLWRINIKDRSMGLGTNKNDPTIIRHLHDLYSLKDVLIRSENFINLVNSAYLKDKGRGGSETNLSIIEMITNTIQVLKEDKVYKDEYKQFVDSMSYAKENEKITFDQGITVLEEIRDKLKPF